jgi:hypothetical protein
MRLFSMALTLFSAACVFSSAYAERPENLTNDASLLAFLGQLAEANLPVQRRKPGAVSRPSFV